MSERIFIPPNIECEIPDTPPIWIDENNRVTGLGLSNSNLDDLPNFRGITRGVAEWYSDNPVVNMDTYGGRKTEEGKNVGMDLCCLFYSCLKAISPDVQNVSIPYKGDREHILERAFITRTFKQNLAEYLFMDLNDPSEEEINFLLQDAILYPNRTPKQQYTRELEKRIKAKYVAFIIRSSFFNDIIEVKYKLKNEANRIAFMDRLATAINIRKELLKVKNNLIHREDLSDDEEELLASVQQDLQDPESEFNILEEEISALYPDPRQHLYQSHTVGSTQNVNQYAFSHEIRQLPLTTGIFNLPVMFTVESDLRADEFDSKNVPLDGRLKAETIIDQLLVRKDHGFTILSMLCQVTGFNGFCLNGRGEPHKDFPFIESHTTHVDILSILLERIQIGSWVDVPISLADPEAPCFVIKFDPGHYESIAVLHKMDVSKCGVDRKTIYQAQSVFSYYDPFIVRFREHEQELKEEKIRSSREKKVEKPAESKLTRTIRNILKNQPTLVPSKLQNEIPVPEKITEPTLPSRPYQLKTFPREEKKILIESTGPTISKLESTKTTTRPKLNIGTIRTRNAQLINNENFEKAVLELSDEGLMNPEYMTKEEQLSFIKDLVNGMEALGEEVTIEHYLKDKADEYDSKQNTPVKDNLSSTGSKFVGMNYDNMDFRQKMAYWDNEMPNWRDLFDKQTEYTTKSDFLDSLAQKNVAQSPVQRAASPKKKKSSSPK